MMDTLDEWPKCDQSKIDPEYICKKCKRILYNPHQADDCGCRYCYNCLDELLRLPENKCISCELQFASKNKIPDKFMQRKVHNLKVKCIEPDCQFTGKLIEYKDHYQEHTRASGNNCPHCSTKFSTKDALLKHLDFAEGDCPKKKFSCPYEKLGCDMLKSISGTSGSSKKQKIDEASSERMDVGSDDGKRTREEIDKHLHECVKYHLDLVQSNTERNIGEMKKSIDSIYSEIDRMRGIDAEAVGFRLPSGREEMEVSIGDSTTPKNLTQDVIAKSQYIEDLKVHLGLVDTAQKAFTTDISKLLKNYHMLKSENEKLRETINETRQQSQELQKTLALTQVSMLALEERLINQEKVSYNGTLMWKITNVNERIQEAKQGRQTSFYSPPFYTSRNGFKMCARIYLNGDGNGRNTHLSLFFVLLRGENDSLLKWPFRQKVSFTLIDQSLSESKEHIIDAFRPDPNSSSFRRPISEMNIASGLPLFCPLAKLMSNDHEYIKDNTMFIKIIVDVKDLPEI